MSNSTAQPPPATKDSSISSTTIIPRQTQDDDFVAFKEKASAWRSLTNRPALPEEARKYRVLAENAYKEKRFDDAANYYEEGLKIEPLWPQAQFNVAMIDSELGRYGDAAYHMRCYVELVPNAKDVEAAKDSAIIWEEKAKTEKGPSWPPPPGLSDEEYVNRAVAYADYCRLKLNIKDDLEWEAIKPKVNAVLNCKAFPILHPKDMGRGGEKYWHGLERRFQKELHSLLNSKQRATAVSLGLLSERELNK